MGVALGRLGTGVGQGFAPSLEQSCLLVSPISPRSARARNLTAELRTLGSDREEIPKGNAGPAGLGRTAASGAKAPRRPARWATCLSLAGGEGGRPRAVSARFPRPSPYRV